MNVVTARCMVLALLATHPCSAEGPNEVDLREAWSQVYLEAAKEVELKTSSSDSPIMLEPRPLLRWHNPVREGETHGDLFAWQRDGQPIVVGTIFSYIYPVGGNVRVAALGLHPLVNEDIRFQFRSLNGLLPGTNLGQFDIELEAGTLVSANPAARLAQVRSLARSCEAWTVNAGVEQPLRLLSQPLLLSNDRLDATKQEKADEAGSPAGDSTAALFAMVTGTDPELLLLVQSRVSDVPGRSVWQITPARFSDLPLKLSVRGESVWQWAAASTPEPYVSRHRIFLRPLDPR